MLEIEKIIEKDLKIVASDIPTLIGILKKIGFDNFIINMQGFELKSQKLNNEMTELITLLKEAEKEENKDKEESLKMMVDKLEEKMIKHNIEINSKVMSYIFENIEFAYDDMVTLVCKFKEIDYLENKDMDVFLFMDILENVIQHDKFKLFFKRAFKLLTKLSTNA